MTIGKVALTGVLVPLFGLVAIAIVASLWAVVEHRDAAATFWGVFGEVGRLVGSALPF